jgi:hypothetical protein
VAALVFEICNSLRVRSEVADEYPLAEIVGEYSPDVPEEKLAIAMTGGRREESAAP